VGNSARKNLSAVAVISIAVLALLFFWSALMVVTFRIPQTGASATCDDRACWKITHVQSGTPAARAGLRNGDIVVYADPVKPLCFWWLKCRPFRLFSGQAVPRFQLARPVTLAVKRGSHNFYVTLDPSMGSASYPLADFLTFVIRLVVYTAFVVLGTWLVLLRPGLMSWMFFAICVSLSAPYGLANLTYVQVLQHGAPLDTFFNISTAFQLGVTALPMFLLRFPNDSSPGWRRRMLVFALCTLPGLFLLFSLSDFFIEFLPELNIAILLFSLGILAVIYAQAGAADRKRLQWAVVGIAAAIVAALMINSISAISMSITHWYATGILDQSSLARDLILDAVALLYAMMLICFTYAIVKHRVIDVRFIVTRGIVIGMMLLLFGAAFAGLDWLFTQYVFQSLWRIAIGMAVAFAMGWLAPDSVRVLVSWFDRAVFKKRYTAMTDLRDLRFALEREARPEELQRVVTFAAAEALKLGSAALFVPASDGGFIRQAAEGWGSGTAWHLLKDDPIVREATHRSKPFGLQDFVWNDMGVPHGTGEPALAVPLISRHKLVGLAVYGAHLSGAEIDPDETRLLRDLCAVAAFAFDQRITGILAAPAYAAKGLRHDQFGA
jgi:hypothetical protein